MLVCTRAFVMPPAAANQVMTIALPEKNKESKHHSPSLHIIRILKVKASIRSLPPTFTWHAFRQVNSVDQPASTH
jgi:hypothetical protein